jgi:hypothetical protein
LLNFYHYAFSGTPQFLGVQQALLAMGAKVVDAAEALALFKQLTNCQAGESAERSEACSEPLERAHQYQVFSTSDALPSSAHPTVCMTAIGPGCVKTQSIVKTVKIHLKRMKYKEK